MNIGGTHAISNKFEVQSLSAVVVQYPLYNCTTRKEIQNNLDSILTWMDNAATGFPGYDLIVTPENGIQGLTSNILDTLIEYDSPEIQQLKDKCKMLKVWGIFNPWVKEFEGRKYCNLAIMINDKGEIVHNYVKMNPYIPGENNCPGWTCPVTPGPKGSRIATIICADGDYPEVWREAAYNGANIIVRISHYMSPYDRAWKITNVSGAYYNQVYVIACNNVGLGAGFTYFGNSMIVNPDGTIITEAPPGNFEWAIKADLYPQIVDNCQNESVSNNLLWNYRHRGASYPEIAGTGAGLEIYQSLKESGEV